MKKLMASVLSLACVLGLAGCADEEAVSGPGGPVSAYIGDSVTTVEITHHMAGETTQWTAAGEDVDSLRAWASELEYVSAAFEEGHSPGDGDGGEAYDFVLTGGDYPGFSYIINGPDNCYLLIEDCWYSVANPSNPPVNGVQAGE